MCVYLVFSWPIQQLFTHIWPQLPPEEILELKIISNKNSKTNIELSWCHSGIEKYEWQTKINAFKSLQKWTLTVCLWELLNWVFWPLSRVFAGSRETFTFGTTAFNRRVGKKAQTGSGNPFEQTRLIILLFYFSMTIILNCAQLAELSNCSMFLQNWRKPAVSWTK